MYRISVYDYVFQNLKYIYLVEKAVPTVFYIRYIEYTV